MKEVEKPLVNQFTGTNVRLSSYIKTVLAKKTNFNHINATVCIRIVGTDNYVSAKRKALNSDISTIK